MAHNCNTKEKIASNGQLGVLFTVSDFQPREDRGRVVIQNGKFPGTFTVLNLIITRNKKGL